VFFLLSLAAALSLAASGKNVGLIFFNELLEVLIFGFMAFLPFPVGKKCKGEKWGYCPSQREKCEKIAANLPPWFSYVEF
jgi:hypothetical protein